MEDIKSYEDLTEYSDESLKRLVLTLIGRLEDERKEKDRLREDNAFLKEKLEKLDEQLRLLTEQIAISNRRRFGRSSEKTETTDGQYAFCEGEDGSIVYFNEAEAVVDAYGSGEEEEGEESDNGSDTKAKKKKEKVVKKKDIDTLPKVEIEHRMTEKELAETFGEGGYKTLPDEVQYCYRFVPASLCIEEHHIGVYASRTDDRIVKADHPGKLIRNSLVSPSMEAGIINAKYVNAMPLYRQSQEFQRWGANVTTQNMANWTIMCSERYLSLVYDRLHELLYGYHVIQADETPVKVNRDGRPAGSESYMWLYRTGEMYRDRAIVLYEYQKTRNQSHPREFLDGYSGTCVTDGYQVYHNIEEEIEGLKIAGCWAHVRRRYDEAEKATPKGRRNGSLAHEGLSLIRAIYREEKKLRELSPEERLEQRRLVVAPLVDAYFEWAKGSRQKALNKSKTWDGINYSLNQEKYLRVFLEDGEVPIDNNAAERAIRPFCVGKKNWVMIDTVHGAKASAIIYSLVETAKANNLKVYDYIKHLLTEIPKHMDETDRGFLDDLLPWSEKLPPECRKQPGNQVEEHRHTA